MDAVPEEGFSAPAGGVATERDGSPVRITSRTFAAGGKQVHGDFMSRYAVAQGE